MELNLRSKLDIVKQSILKMLVTISEMANIDGTSDIVKILKTELAYLKTILDETESSIEMLPIDPIIISDYKKSIIISGPTKDYKEIFKSIGCSWNSTLKGWIYQKSNEDKLIQILKDKEIKFVKKPYDFDENVV
jgi:uncharacterized protein (UPF0216 family)